MSLWPVMPMGPAPSSFNNSWKSVSESPNTSTRKAFEHNVASQVACIKGAFGFLRNLGVGIHLFPVEKNVNKADPMAIVGGTELGPDLTIVEAHPPTGLFVLGRQWKKKTANR